MSMEEIFAEAVERLEKGEPLDAILASYPEAVRAELAALLLVVEDVIDLALQAAPTPSPVRRLDARTQFMQAIVEMKAARAPAAPPELAPVAPTLPRPKPAPPPQPSLLDNLRTWLQEWRETPFGAFAFNLAPLAALLLAAYLATAWVSSTAQAAVPGDPTYRIKEWARETNTELAAPEERSELQRKNDAEIQREMELVTTRAANLESVAPRATLKLQFRGMDGRIFLVGPLRVLPNYQPDRQADAVEALTIEGDLQIGVPVELEYQILPGNPGLVQGIAIRVLGAPEPTPEQVETPAVFVPMQDGTACQTMVIPGWEPLAIFPGMKVTDIASRAGISIFDLMAVNCLEEQEFTSRAMILVPENYYIKVTPTSMPTAAPPVYRPPVAPAAPTATPTRRPTRTPAPTATAPEESAPDATATAENPDAPTATPTDAPVDPAAPIIEPTATPTHAATDAPTDTPTAVATDAPTETPTAEPTEEATVAPTEAPTATPTEESVDSSEAAPTAAINARPTATATVEKVATATQAPPTPEPPPTATRAPPTDTPAPRPTDPPPRPTDPPPPRPTDPPPPPEPEPTSPPPDAGGGEGGSDGGAGGDNPASGANFRQPPDAA
jgi:hypothetical protein